MEPGVRAFLQRISLSLGIGILWLALNSTFGIMYDYAFVHEALSTGNIIFYIWLTASFAILLWLYIRIWKKPLDIHDKEHFPR